LAIQKLQKKKSKSFGSDPSLAGRRQPNHPAANKIKSLHHNGNPLKQKRRCSNIPGRLHQSPAAQLAQEIKSIPVDWAVGLHRNRDELTL